jgi:hypothetical protein
MRQAKELKRLMTELLKDINTILLKHGVSEKILLEDITITEKTVTDLAKQKSKLSESIIDSLWPSISSACVFHYTTREAAESILNSGIFRLYSIAKRYGEGEIVAFCKTHQLQGYLEKDSNWDPTYKNLLMPNIYYTSFADINLTKEDEKKLWDEFAAPDGVRLKLEVSTSGQNKDFRKIIYKPANKKPIGVLWDLLECIKKKYNRAFILTGWSRLCAFYLPAHYGLENEYRMLYRVWEGSKLQPKKDGKNAYLELPLNSMNECGYKLNIIEVNAYACPKMPKTYIFSKRN